MQTRKGRDNHVAQVSHVLFLIRKVDCNDGISTYCRVLSAGLMARGISVSMISGEINDNGSNTNRQAQKKSLSQWISIPSIRQIPSPFLFMKLTWWIKKHKISIINVHGLGMLMWGKMLSMVTGVPLVATYHPSVSRDLASTIASSNRPFNFNQRLALRLFIPDRLVVLSEESKTFLEQQCTALKTRTYKIYGGIDDAHFRTPSESERQAARLHLHLEDNDVVCLLVGRATWNKGHDLLIRAARQIRQQYPDLPLKCYFVGSGGDDLDIQRFAFIDDEDRNSFKFFGYVEDIREVLWAADMFVLPSRLEGFALAVAEAMSTGLVPIRTPSGGAADQIIVGETGFIVPFEDVDALAAAILKLTDADRRHTMRRNCINLAKSRFSGSALVDRAIGLMNSLARWGNDSKIRAS